MNDFSAQMPPSSGSVPPYDQPEPPITANTSVSYVDDYLPPQSAVTNTSPTPVASPAAMPASPTQSVVSQTLEDQNIFHLLGVMDGAEAEKESFLDQLQQVIWEDFLERDVELLVTEEELEQLKAMMLKSGITEVQRQEEMITFLNQLIPDLEEIMLEKALELKEDMVRERMTGMREYYAGNSGALAELDKAEKLINDDQWRDAADVLNAIK